MEKVNLVKCDSCKKELAECNFYKIITEKLNKVTMKYEPYKVCKKCIITDYFLNETSNFKQNIRYICEKYNLYYDVKIVESIISKNNTEYKLNEYLKDISSLRQHIDKKFKDSVFENELQSTIDKEKTDIEFIDEDIKGIKYHIEYSLKQHDHNAHNKWMNCLRDALELKDKLYITEVREITYKNGISIGESLKSISKRIKCHDISKQIGNIINVPINISENVYDVLRCISDSWEHLSEESQKEISKIIAGERDKETIKVILDSLN